MADFLSSFDSQSSQTGMIDLVNATKGQALNMGELVKAFTNLATAITSLASTADSGTFTPAITFATNGDLVVAYDNQYGHYWRQGSLVFWRITLVTNTFTHTTSSGALRITGLPFTVKNEFDNRGLGVCANFRGITKAGYTQFSPIAINNTTYLTLRACTSGSTYSDVASADMPTAGSVTLEMSGWYLPA